MSPIRLQRAVEAAQKTDPQYKELTRQLNDARSKRQFNNGPRGEHSLTDMRAVMSKMKDLEAKQKSRCAELAGEIPHPDAKPGLRPNTSRPGEDPSDMPTNDKRDLRQCAEEMRLLLGYLNPAERSRLQIDPASPAALPCVAHALPADSPQVSIADGAGGAAWMEGARCSHSARQDDVVLKPVQDVVPFMREWTSEATVDELRKQPEVIALYDDFIHDSRCWFKVPWFREYAPGGYFWPRVVFVGNEDRARWLGVDPLKVALDMNQKHGLDVDVNASRIEVA